MPVSVNESKKTGGKETNNLVHLLDPKTFVKMFTMEKSFEEKLIQDILKCICALRNSGGGMLTIWFTETCSISEADECVHIIKNAVDAVLSDTGKGDLLEWKFSNRIMFLVQGSKEIVTMKYNMYVMKDGEAKLVPSTKCAAEVRFLLHGQKEQPSTKYVMNIQTDEEAKPVPSTQSHKFHEKNRKPFDFTDEYTSVQEQSSQEGSFMRREFYGGTKKNLRNYRWRKRFSMSPRRSPISNFVKGKKVKMPAKIPAKMPAKMPAKEQMIRFELLSNIQSNCRSIESGILLDVYKRYLPMTDNDGGHVYYGISPDGTVCGDILNEGEQEAISDTLDYNFKRNIDFDFIPVRNNNGKIISNLLVIVIYVPPCSDYEQSGGFHSSLVTTPSNQLPSISFTCSREGKIEKRKLDQVELVKDQRVKVSTTKLLEEKVKFKILEDDKLTGPRNSVAHRITLEKNELLPYVSAFANHHGGELYYGVSSDGTVCGETISETEIEEVYEKVKKNIASMVWPKHVDEIHKFWEITFLHVKDSADIKVKDQDAFNPNLYVLKICVKPCQGRVHVEDPVSYHVVENSAEKLSFNKWITCLQNSNTKLSHSTAFVEFKANEKAFDRFFLPNDYQTFLKRLEWVESFKIVDGNEECIVRHLEIVCKLGKVPCTADIVPFFGEEILPFIAYQEGSKREWFETNIFDENSDMKQKYEDELASLSWVEDFYIGVASEPEKSWQIYVTCAENKVPSMVDLKKIFGVNIASFVDFIQESVDEDSEGNEESLPPSDFLRGPISGDELCVQEDKGGYGAIGVLTAANEKHYATTCYHVCFKEELPKKDLKKGHEILMKDCANESQGCQGATCLYTTEEERKLLGQFCHGLYDDNHDIAIIELDQSLDCSDMVKFLTKKNIKPVLANKEEVRDMFYDGELPVHIIRSASPEGKLFAITGRRRFPRNNRCYRIKGSRSFASEGDSGSLLYLMYENERIPFGYLCMDSGKIEGSKKIVYFCRNLSHSIEELKRHSNRDDLNPCLNDH